MGRLRTQASLIAVAVLAILILLIGWLASNLVQDLIRIVGATATPTVTATPSATPTASLTPTVTLTFTATPTDTLTPTRTATPTSTPTPSPTATPTPLPTYTPYPTYTAVPTFTPFPTATPIACNPSRRDPSTMRANLANSPGQARSILLDTLKRWTRAQFLPRVGSPTVAFYLTYLGPQVVEAIVLDRAVREGIPPEGRPDLLVEYDRALETRNVFPFVLTVRGPQDGSRQVTIAPLPQSMMLITQNRQSIPASSQSAAVFGAPIDLARGGAAGHVLFPRSTGTGCTPTINLAIDRSFDVSLSGIALSGFLSIPFMSNDSVMWSFDSLPDTSLEQTLRIPMPNTVANVDPNTLSDIIGVAYNLFGVVLK